MTAKVIDGKVIAAELRDKVTAEVSRLKRDHNITPGLAVVLVGNDPASEVYVRSKHRQSVAAGMASFEHKLPADVSQDELLATVRKLNADRAVHGILVQLPLPKAFDTEKVIATIDPAKDVDGLHPINAGRLAGGFAAPAPCTPVGCIILSKSVHRSLEGMNAIVLAARIRRPPAGAAVAQRERHGDDRPFAHARSRGAVPAGGSRLCRRRPRRDGEGRLDQARRHRDRHRHHAFPRRETARIAWSATSPTMKRCRLPAR